MNISSKVSPLDKKKMWMGYNFNIKGQFLLKIRGEKYSPLVQNMDTNLLLVQ